MEGDPDNVNVISLESGVIVLIFVLFPPLFIAPVTIEVAEIPETENVAVAPDPESLFDHVSVPEIKPNEFRAVEPLSYAKDPDPVATIISPSEDDTPKALKSSRTSPIVCFSASNSAIALSTLVADIFPVADEVTSAAV